VHLPILCKILRRSQLHTIKHGKRIKMQVEIEFHSCKQVHSATNPLRSCSLRPCGSAMPPHRRAHQAMKRVSSNPLRHAPVIVRSAKTRFLQTLNNALNHDTSTATECCVSSKSSSVQQSSCCSRDPCRDPETSCRLR
jgi:hypothetical protein